MTVEEEALDKARAQISPSLGATTYTIDSEKIDSQSQGEFASFDQTFYRFPGVVPVSVFLLHSFFQGAPFMPGSQKTSENRAYYKSSRKDRNTDRLVTPIKDRLETTHADTPHLFPCP